MGDLPKDQTTRVSATQTERPSASSSPEPKPRIVVPAGATLLSILMAALLWGGWVLLHSPSHDSPPAEGVESPRNVETSMSARRIQIAVDGVSVVATLNDSPVADAVWQALPLAGRAELWGDELYFSIPVQAEETGDARETVEKGDVAFWAPGSALCLFWGPTPMSRGDEIRPASAVTVVGRIEGDPEVLGEVAAGARITVERSGR